MVTIGQVATALSCVFGLFLLSVIFPILRRNKRTTLLKGPASKSLLFGRIGEIHSTPDPSDLYEGWAKEYGPVYSVPGVFGSTRVILRDPKAIAHFYLHESTLYVRHAGARLGVELIVDRGLLWAEGEDHKRQRRVLNPAFSNAAIRDLTPIFFDSGYKIKTAWDALIDSTGLGEAVIEVQSWMNRTSMDNLGIAGLSYDFKCLEGENPEIVKVFEEFSGLNPSFLAIICYILATFVPIFMLVPTDPIIFTRRLNKTMGDIANKILHDWKEVGSDKAEAIIGTLLKAQDQKSGLYLSREEIISQMKVFILAGYETTSISLTWALLELSKRQDIQNRLREELSEYSTSDPTWDQLTHNLPYLDAVVHEVLRLYAPSPVTERIVGADDVIPLSSRIEARDGTLIDSVFVAAGTEVVVSIGAVNRSEAFWGPDAAVFNPERWLSEDGIAGAKDLQGYRHLMTFADGPRICLGKGFAVASVKAVLSTLIRNFSFELKGDPEIEMFKGVLPRPNIVGEDGPKIPLLVRRMKEME